MKIDNPTPAQRRILTGLLDGFRMLGPVESLSWLAEYFETSAKAMAAHGHPIPWCDDLVREVKALHAKYKAIAEAGAKTVIGTSAVAVPVCGAEYAYGSPRIIGPVRTTTCSLPKGHAGQHRGEEKC